ncbi:MAG: hypothetical protein ACRD36_12005, partial [Candidatus Acidiferrum sp.]
VESSFFPFGNPENVLGLESLALRSLLCDPQRSCSWQYADNFTPLPRASPDGRYLPRAES